jgi:class 3 adenylate cyclase
LQHLAYLKEKAEKQEQQKELSLLEKEKQLQAAELKTKQQEIESKNTQRNLFIGGTALMLLLATSVFTGLRRTQKEKKVSEQLRVQSDNLLHNILPEEVAAELKEKGSTAAKQFDEVSILFTDFVNFTQTAELLTPTELVAELHKNFIAFDAIMEKHGLEKIKTIGDAYLAVCGLPNPAADHAQRVVNSAIDIRTFVEKNNNRFQIRIGVHSGSVVAGIVGAKKFAYDIWGDTVNTASRMECSSEPGKINISETTYQLVKDDFHCTHRGKITAKGKGEIDMYFVTERV